MPEVDGLVANASKLDAARLECPQPPRTYCRTQHTRAFIAVQNGCDHACTFCVIPQGRGASRSLSIGAKCCARSSATSKQGVAEVVLTGVDVTSWGHDLPGQPAPRHARRARSSTRFPNLPRLRMSSLDGIEIDAGLFELFAGEPRIMPHLHLSLQHGHDLILKRMRRRHSRADAGQPGRAPAAPAAGTRGRRRPDRRLPDRGPKRCTRANLLDRRASCDVVHGHVFPYSPRPRTPGRAHAATRQGDNQAAAPRRTARRGGAAVAMTWLRRPGRHDRRRCSPKPTAPAMPSNFARVALPEGTPRGAVLALTPTALDGRPPAMSDKPTWSERLFGGFRKTSERLSENLAAAWHRPSPSPSPSLPRSPEPAPDARPPPPLPARRLHLPPLRRPPPSIVAKVATTITNRQARRRDARPCRGRADPVRPGPSAAARIRAKLAEKRFGLVDHRARAQGSRRRGNRRDPAPGGQAARDHRLPAPAGDPGDRGQRQRQDHHHRQDGALVPGAGLRRPARRRRHLPRRGDRATRRVGRAASASTIVKGPRAATRPRSCSTRSSRRPTPGSTR